MATIQASIHGIQLARDPSGGGLGNVAIVTFSMPAYTASSDAGKIGAGGYLFGVATTDTLATMIQNTRRDGKTVTLRGATNVESGLHGSTQFYAASLAVSSGSLTFNVADVSGSEIDAASGVSDRPISIAVHYTLA